MPPFIYFVNQFKITAIGCFLLFEGKRKEVILRYEAYTKFNIAPMAVPQHPADGRGLEFHTLFPHGARGVDGHDSASEHGKRRLQAHGRTLHAGQTGQVHARQPHAGNAPVARAVTALLYPMRHTTVAAARGQDRHAIRRDALANASRPAASLPQATRFPLDLMRQACSALRTEHDETGSGHHSRTNIRHSLSTSSKEEIKTCTILYSLYSSPCCRHCLS